MVVRVCVYVSQYLCALSSEVANTFSITLSWTRHLSWVGGIEAKSGINNRIESDEYRIVGTFFSLSQTSFSNSCVCVCVCEVAEEENPRTNEFSSRRIEGLWGFWESEGGGQKVNPSFGLFHFLVSRMAFFLRLYVCVCLYVC